MGAIDEMEMLEFIIFLLLQLFLLILTVWRKGILYSLLGLIFSLFMFGLILKDGVIVTRIEATSTVIYANQTLCVLILALMVIIHSIAMWGVRK